MKRGGCAIRLAGGASEGKVVEIDNLTTTGVEFE